MLRRSHKKSRNGCSQCKRRHVKCDERRPRCILCSMSGRDCSYASQPPSDGCSSGTSPLERNSPSDSHSQDALTVPDVTSLTVLSLSGSQNYPGLVSEDVINFRHMELLVHLTSTREMFNLGDNVGPYPDGVSLALKAALKAPYLMYQLLAFSSRHLAFIYPEQSTSYLHHAVSLQARAVSLFNSSSIQVDRSNCVAILLFSTTLGHHLLADTLNKRDPGGLEAFMTHYVQCVQVHRGIYTVTMAAWPLLMESDLEQILLRSTQLTSRVPRGMHCQKITEMINSTDALSEEGRTACRVAIKYLQVGFDALLTPENHESWAQYQMIFLWTVVAPQEFTGLLSACQPEALVVLAYYALLLHHGRSMWQVGDSGKYILRMIIDYLGSGWDAWLEYPKSIVGTNLH